MSKENDLYLAIMAAVGILILFVLFKGSELFNVDIPTFGNMIAYFVLALFFNGIAIFLNNPISVWRLITGILAGVWITLIPAFDCWAISCGDNVTSGGLFSFLMNKTNITPLSEPTVFYSLWYFQWGVFVAILAAGYMKRD